MMSIVTKPCDTGRFVLSVMTMWNTGHCGKGEGSHCIVGRWQEALDYAQPRHALHNVIVQGRPS